MEIGKPIVRVARREEFDQTSRDADARQYIEYYLDNPDYVLIQVLLPLPKALLLDTKFDIPEESLESVKEGLEEGVRLARQHYAAPEGDSSCDS